MIGRLASSRIQISFNSRDFIVFAFTRFFFAITRGSRASFIEHLRHVDPLNPCTRTFAKYQLLVRVKCIDV